MRRLSGAYSIVSRTENTLIGVWRWFVFSVCLHNYHICLLANKILTKFLSFLRITIWKLNKSKTFYKGLLLVYLYRVSMLNPNSVNLISKVILRPCCSYAMLSICLFNMIRFCPLWVWGILIAGTSKCTMYHFAFLLRLFYDFKYNIQY